MTEKSNTEISLAIQMEADLNLELDGRYDREKLDKILDQVESTHPQSIEDYIAALEDRGIKANEHIDTTDVVNSHNFMEIQCDDILGAD